MIIGITRGTTKYHIIRATLESIAYQVGDLAELMHTSTGIDIKMLKVDGGASANDLLMSIQADISGADIERPRCVETTALGVALLCGLSLGVYKSIDEIKSYRCVDKIFSPTKDNEWRKENVRQWRRAVKRSLDWKE